MNDGADRLDQEQHLAARIAWLYYREGLTQEAIARRLQLTRARVNRVIGEAREQGLVSIALNYRFSECLALESALKSRFGLDDASVVPAPDDPPRLIDQIGHAAAACLDRLLGDDDTLALGWGRTIAAVGDYLSQRRGRGNTVVSLFGGTPRGYALNPYDLVARFAGILDAQRYYLTVPMLMASVALRDALGDEPSVRRVLDRIAGARVALLSATDLSPDSKSRVFGLIDEQTRRSLLAAGAVGECGGIYLDADGAEIRHEISHHMIGPSLPDLCAIPGVILASGGPQKIDILRACLAAGLGRILVTDTHTAARLLE